MKPWRRAMWCIPPKGDGRFVARMEEVLDVYARPLDPLRPVVCMDEQPKQLISETRAPIPMSPGAVERVDHEYAREGVCTVWMFVEPLGAWRDVRATERRTAVDWAAQVRRLVDDPRYAGAERITLVCDNLNTHDFGSLYDAFPAGEARRVARRLDMVFTPAHGSWLNMAEPELSVLTRQALGDRIASLAEVRARASAWAEDRNRRQTGIDWHYTVDNARHKLKRLYPLIES